MIQYMSNYNAIRSIENTSLPPHASEKKIVLNLTGDMEHYVWSFNNKTLLESNKILIKKGENVRFVLVNQTMMHHPIHLHGHFFRVLNGQGTKSPLMHTVNVPAQGRVEIEFSASEEKDWFFHCHNLYHMKAGMARVVSYQKTTTATPEIFKKLSHDTWYFSGNISALSNMTLGMFRTLNTRNVLEVEYDYNYKKEYDLEVLYARRLTRFLDLYIGGNFERENKDEKPENTAIIGVRYVLPMLIESNLRLNSKGKFRVGLGSNLQLTERSQFQWSWNTDKEYRLVLSYEINKNILLSALYDSDFKWGAGLKVKF